MLTQVGGSAERALALRRAPATIDIPFDPLELVACMWAILRRARVGGQPLAACRGPTSGRLTRDLPSRRALLDGEEIVLTAKAFGLLE
ncbi:MAG TPA: hypothetical protein PLJ35_22410 [Anaerolineae bacterium]|nr:hypothetical protein [Anaerolineae bacterium]HOR01577.1 hypothetical protein [Anaerolineae bacterium]HPL30506.1 hypothetical protein [Anaerolineae bacterium]